MGVLGIEEARSYAGYGHRASVAPNPMAADGMPTFLALSPDASVEVRNVVGGVPWPPEAGLVAEARARQGALQLCRDGGEVAREVAFDDRFLAPRG